ncbi:putative bifunctional diguanylate cyclase/phosphodiesterase [Devosia sp.]|uniref:putative bifunctional diguanylate cyclase/phosphodiesterase n=1 Tax=Devosia sp. TaxID=1871048 RepID=UPI003BA961EC
MRPNAGRDRAAELKRTQALMAEAYLPLHKSVLITVIVYYSYVTAAHFIDETGGALALLAAMSAVTVLCGVVVLVLTLRRALTPVQLELAQCALHLCMLGNVAIYQFLHYTPAKLVYFSLLAVAFALSATTLRLVLLCVLFTLGTMLATVWLFEPSAISTYIFIAIATGFATIGLSQFVRGVIQREVLARIKADNIATEALAVSAENARLAKVDPLTGLPNRRRFFELVDLALAEHPGDPALLVGVVDLDGFKAVNDIFGHSTGDRVLVGVGERLSVSGRLPALVARMGGDEFGILVRGRHPESLIREFAADLASALEPAFRFEGAVATLSGSFGFSRGQPGDGAADILERADYAAYEAKSSARGSAVIFSAEHEALIVAERQLEREILQADLEAEITPVFQPIVDATTNEVVGYEALARWHSPTLGSISPARFIPMAERLGLVPRITQAMVRNVLAAMPMLPENTRVSINLSPRDLSSPAAMQALAGILGTAPRPCRIDFEITETAVMRDIGEAIEALLRLMAYGARISLDDFGTGHSSLSRVQQLPLDRIKVDQSFVAAIETDRTSQAIVKTTIDLCRNLGVSCVIEGVETESQLAALRALGARYCQGYLFGRPTPAAQISAGRPSRLIA